MYPYCYQCAKKYHSRWKFDKVMAKTILHSYFWDTVYIEYIWVNWQCLEWRGRRWCGTAEAVPWRLASRRLQAWQKVTDNTTHSTTSRRHMSTCITRDRIKSTQQIKCLQQNHNNLYNKYTLKSKAYDKSTSGHARGHTDHCTTCCPTQTNPQQAKVACASISLHGWGDTQWPINPPLLSSHSPSFSPPPERCKVSQQVWNRVMNWTWTCVSSTVTFLIRLHGPNDSLH